MNFYRGKHNITLLTPMYKTGPKQLIEQNLNDVFIFVVFIFVVDDCEQRVLANNKNEF